MSDKPVKFSDTDFPRHIRLTYDEGVLYVGIMEAKIERLTAALAAAEVTAWNAAIEAAAVLAESMPRHRRDYIPMSIRALRKETP